MFKIVEELKENKDIPCTHCEKIATYILPDNRGNNGYPIYLCTEHFYVLFQETYTLFRDAVKEN